MHVRDDAVNRSERPDSEAAAPRDRALSLPARDQLRLLGLALLVLALLVGGAMLIGNLFHHEATAPEAQLAPGTFKPTDKQWATLTIATVPARTFRNEHITDGAIALDDDLVTPVFSPYSGRVTRIIAKPGDHVERGAPLFAIAASEFTQAESDLLSARAQYDLAVTNESRQHELYEAQGAALKDWMQAKADLATATATLGAVHNRLRILGKSDADIARIEKGARNPSESAESIVSAPIAGTVLQRQVGPGQFIQSGAQNPVYSIGDLGKVWLVANVREADAGDMHVGDPVDVRLFAFPGRVFKAKLSYVAAQVDPNTHRLPVRAEVENPDDALKPSMFATFTISSGGERTSPAVPDSAVIYEGDAARVWVAHDDHTLALRAIRPGRVSDGQVEVLDGLKAGDKVVTAGTLFIDRAAKAD